MPSSFIVAVVDPFTCDQSSVFWQSSQSCTGIILRCIVSTRDFCFGQGRFSSCLSVRQTTRRIRASERRFPLPSEGVKHGGFSLELQCGEVRECPKHAQERLTRVSTPPDDILSRRASFREDERSSAEDERSSASHVDASPRSGASKESKRAIEIPLDTEK